MTSPAPGAPQRTRGKRGSLIAGIAIAILADAIVLSGAPQLRAAWDAAPVISSGSSQSGLPSAKSPKSSASPSKKASKVPTSGEVAVTGAISTGIVLIDGELSDTSTSSGTGMVLTSTGEVLTNYHVVRSTRSITVRIASTRREYSATLVGRDASRDVALLQLKDAADLATITPDTGEVTEGDPVVAAGNAGGQGFLTAFAGRIVGTDRSIRVRGGSSMDPVEDLSGLLESNAHAVPGDSGGPLYDRDTQVLGMTTAGNASESGKSGTAFAVPIGAALSVVDKIRAGENSGSIVVGPKASIGIMASDSGKGVKVTSVVPGSPAETAGIKVGDYFTAMDDHKIDKVATLVTTLDNYRPGSSVLLHWEHGDEERSFQATLVASTYN